MAKSSKTPKNPRKSHQPSTNGAARTHMKPPTIISRAPMMGMTGEDGALDNLHVDPSEKIATWFENIYAKSRKVATIQLLQRTTEGRFPIESWDLADIGGDEPDSIATTIYSRAQEAAQENHSITSYVIALFEPDRQIPFAHLAFKVMPEDYQGGFESEPGHLAEGHMAQAHRHNEAVMRLFVGMAAESQRTMSREHERLTRNQERMAEMQLTMLQTQQQMLDRSAMRDLHVTQAKYKIERKERLMRQGEGLIFKYAPILLGKFGLEEPKQLPAKGGTTPANGSGATNGSAAATNGSAAASDTPVPVQGQIVLTEAELPLLHRVMATVLGTVAYLDNTNFELVLGRVPEGYQDDVRTLRAQMLSDSKTRKSASSAEHRPKSQEDQKRVLSFRNAMLGLLCDLSETELSYVISKIPEKARGDAMALRTLLKQKEAAAQAVPAAKTEATAKA